jgi:hypothetical protein
MKTGDPISPPGGYVGGGMRIAAGNVPNFIDLTTGGWGAAIQDSLNSNQTQTMANFATIADALTGCITRSLPMPVQASSWLRPRPQAGPRLTH